MRKGLMKGKGMGKGKGSIGMQGEKLVRHKQQVGVHTVSPEEREAFIAFINAALKNDADLKDLLPIPVEDESALFERVKDGVLLCKLINVAVPGTVDERTINKKKGGKEVGVFQALENLNNAIGGARAIGCVVVNVGANDLSRGTQHVVLGLLWQIAKISLLVNINLKNHPELYRLLQDGETMDDLLALPPQQLLVRWVNYHLERAGHSDRRIKGFGKSDIGDSEVYTILLNQLNPKLTKESLNHQDLTKRAGKVLADADKLAADQDTTLEWAKFLKPRDIVSGNSRLNLALVASIFNVCPGLEDLDEEQQEEFDASDLFDAEGTREARAFVLWLNSLGLEGVQVNSLFQDLRDGLVILKAEDAIEPGTVNWKQIKQTNINKFAAVGNCNTAVDVAKADPFFFSLVGIGGPDIQAGQPIAVLALVWQLMRNHVISLLKDVSDVMTIRGKNFKPVTDADVIKWANTKTKLNGKTTQMKDFHDKSLSNGLFLIDLCAAIRPAAVDYSFVNANAQTDEEKMENARYAISTARKMGALLFCLPEDIVEVSPKMLMTFTAALMAVDRRGG